MGMVLNKTSLKELKEKVQAECNRRSQSQSKCQNDAEKQQIKKYSITDANSQDYQYKNLDKLINNTEMGTVVTLEHFQSLFNAVNPFTKQDTSKFRVISDLSIDGLQNIAKTAKVTGCNGACTGLCSSECYGTATQTTCDYTDGCDYCDDYCEHIDCSEYNEDDCPEYYCYEHCTDYCYEHCEICDYYEYED